MFACCLRGPCSRVAEAGGDEDMPAAAPPATHLKSSAAAAAASAAQPAAGREDLEDEGFTILTEEELREAVANADAGNGSGGHPQEEGGDETESPTFEARDGGWDCHYTDLAMLTYPPGQPEGDPVKVNEYEFEGHLGAGSFGSVRLAQRVVGEPPYRQYAVKVMSKHRLRRMKKSIMNGPDGRMVVRTGEDLITSEINVMRHLYHRNVVLLFEVISDPAEDNIFMVMEYLESGLSMKYDKERKRFYSPITNGVLTDALAAKLFFGLVSGLQYLHSKRVCHRDIKPENLLLTDGTKLRITDFGCALQLDEAGDIVAGSGSVEGGLLVDTAGTFSFLPPEACGGEPYSPWPADVWAAGVTLYCFVFGRLPFRRDGVAELFQQIQEEPMRFPEPEEGEDADDDDGAVLPPSPGCQEILRGLFEKDPSARWALERVRAHGWLEAPRVEDEEEDRRRDEAEAAEAAAKEAAKEAKGAAQG